MARESSVFLNLLNLNPKKIESITSFFENIDDLFKAKRNDLQRIPLLEDKDISKILELRESDILSRELGLIAKESIRCLDIFDEGYPSILKEISRPPLVLYVKGDPEVLSQFLFSIVGSRIPTVYGISVAENFSYRLSLLGIVIVSGLARGIDTAAHKGAIKKGRSVAVLGSGLLNVYPSENRELAERIIQGKGAVISEFPLFTPPLKENFPRRNRIVSGLSKGVLVVEAARQSGALITARLACEQNRDVFSVPGSIDSPLSQGTHLLIKEGAKLTESLEDILEEIDFKPVSDGSGSLNLNLTDEENEVFEMIKANGMTSLEEIFSGSKFEQAFVNRIVLDLQLKGLIKEVKPFCFSRTLTGFN